MAEAGGKSITSQVIGKPLDSEHRSAMLETNSLGPLLKDWRLRRRMSQLDLACEAGISSKHLSFVETGRSHPSRDMLLRLAEGLSLPLRERNELLTAGGYAAIYSTRALNDHPPDAVRKAIDQLLRGHEPFPAVALDRYWNVVAGNGSIGILLQGVDPQLLAEPINSVRITLHPKGIAPRIINHGEWRDHILHRLQQQLRLTGDPKFKALLDEATSYPAPPHSSSVADDNPVMALQLRFGEEILSLISTTTVFGTPMNVSLSELAIETFFPADEPTREILLRLGEI